MSWGSAVRAIPTAIQAAGTAYSAYQASKGATQIVSVDEKVSQARRRAMEMAARRASKSIESGFESALVGRGQAGGFMTRLGHPTLLGNPRS